MSSSSNLLTTKEGVTTNNGYVFISQIEWVGFFFPFQDIYMCVCVYL